MSTLLRSNLVVAAGTALSRITGLGRVAVFSAVIGQAALADAYTIGNETPNIVYELLIGGVLSATLVPLFTSFLEHDDDESTNVVVTVALVVLAAVTTVAVVAAPLRRRRHRSQPPACRCRTALRTGHWRHVTVAPPAHNPRHPPTLDPATTRDHDGAEDLGSEGRGDEGHTGGCR